MERKVHYKSYKSGKFWVAALISVSLGTVGVITIPQIFEAVPVYADASLTDVTATVDHNDFLNYFKLGGPTTPGKQPAIPYPAGQQGYQVQLTADAQGQAGNVALKTKR